VDVLYGGLQRCNYAARNLPFPDRATLAFLTSGGIRGRYLARADAFVCRCAVLLRPCLVLGRRNRAAALERANVQDFGRKRRRLIRERVPADHGISRLNCS
jgi:hypothetical protein